MTPPELTPQASLVEAFAWFIEHAETNVLAVNEKILMADAQAAPILGVFSHREIWQWAHDQSQAVVGWQPLPFLDGRHTRLLWTVLTGTGAIEGAVVAIDAAAAPARPRAEGALLLDVFPGVSGEAKAVRSRLESFLAEGLALIITGETGVGKDVVAARLIEARAHKTGARTVDPLVIRGEQALASTLWLGRLEDAVARGRPILFHDLDRVPDFDIHRWLAPLERARSLGVPVVATRDLVVSDFALRMWSRALPHALVLPPLRLRPDDIPVIAGAVLASIAGSRAVPKLPAEALRLLASGAWPGNVTELKAVLVDAHQRCGGTRIEPWALRVSGRGGQGSMAEVERRTIVEALDRAKGNKQVAAARLGISRSTLYRKLRALGLD